MDEHVCAGLVFLLFQYLFSILILSPSSTNVLCITPFSQQDILGSSCDVDVSCSLSEGQVIISQQPIGITDCKDFRLETSIKIFGFWFGGVTELSSMPLDGSSEGQIILPNDQRSSSTASFRSAAGSPGQINQTTDDDFMSQ